MVAARSRQSYGNIGDCELNPIFREKKGLLKIFEEFRALEIEMPKYRC